MLTAGILGDKIRRRLLDITVTVKVVGSGRHHTVGRDVWTMVWGRGRSERCLVLKRHVRTSTGIAGGIGGHQKTGRGVGTWLPCVWAVRQIGLSSRSRGIAVVGVVIEYGRGSHGIGRHAIQGLNR